MHWAFMKQKSQVPVFYLSGNFIKTLPKIGDLPKDGTDYLRLKAIEARLRTSRLKRFSEKLPRRAAVGSPGGALNGGSVAAIPAATSSMVSCSSRSQCEAIASPFEAVATPSMNTSFRIMDLLLFEIVIFRREAHDKRRGASGAPNRQEGRSTKAGILSRLLSPGLRFCL
jgi:hypothetical protein